MHRTGVTPVLPAEYQKVEWIGVRNKGINYPTAYLEILNAIKAGDTIHCKSKINTVLGTESAFLGYQSSWEFYYENANSIKLWNSEPDPTQSNFTFTIDNWDESSVSFVKNTNLRILGYSTNKYAFNGNINSVIIENSNREITHNYIPCYRKSDDVIGMYDTISQTFHTNAGTGSFVKGADI